MLYQSNLSLALNCQRNSIVEGFQQSISSFCGDLENSRMYKDQKREIDILITYFELFDETRIPKMELMPTAFELSLEKRVKVWPGIFYRYIKREREREIYKQKIWGQRFWVLWSTLRYKNHKKHVLKNARFLRTRQKQYASARMAVGIKSTENCAGPKVTVIPFL